jgi:hypothetical protein
MSFDIIVLKIKLLQMLFNMIFVNLEINTKNTVKTGQKSFNRAVWQLFKLISKTLSINQ